MQGREWRRRRAGKLCAAALMTLPLLTNGLVALFPKKLSPRAASVRFLAKY